MKSELDSQSLEKLYGEINKFESLIKEAKHSNEEILKNKQEKSA